MAYEVVMPYHLHMPSYFLETFTEYPYLDADCEALLIKKCCCDRKSEKEFVSLYIQIKSGTMDMSFEQLNFVVYCIGSVADALKMNARKVHQLLKTSGILNNYIIPSYDVLHTFSKEYLVEDVVSLMKEKGVLP